MFQIGYKYLNQHFSFFKNLVSSNNVLFTSTQPYTFFFPNFVFETRATVCISEIYFHKHEMTLIFTVNDKCHFCTNF